MKKILGFGLINMLLGCVGVYKAPVGADLPTITFEGQYSLLLIYKNGTNCSDGVGIPKPYSPWEPNSLPLPIKPDIDTTFQVRQYGISTAGGLASVTCGGLFTFVPKNGYEYKLSFKDHGNSCTTIILEKMTNQPDNKFQPAAFKRRAEKFAMTTKGSVCSD